MRHFRILYTYDPLRARYRQEKRLFPRRSYTMIVCGSGVMREA